MKNLTVLLLLFSSNALFGQRLLEIEKSFWYNNSWSPDVLECYDYYSDGKEKSLTSKFWQPGILEYGNNQRRTRIYSHSGLVQDLNYEIWNKSKSIWELYSKQSDSYYSSNGLKTSLRYSLDSGLWKNELFIFKNYNAQQSVIKDSLIRWYQNIPSYYETYYSYDSNEKLSTVYEVTYSTPLAKGDTNERAIYQYPTKGILTVNIQNKYSGFWENDYTKWYFSNDSNKLTEYREIYPRGTRSARNKRKLYTYNSKGKMKEIIEQKWDVDSMDWQNFSKATYLYDATLFQVENSINQQLSIYPNPVNSIMFVDLTNFEGQYVLELYNLQNQSIKLEQALFIGLNKIDLTDFEKGLYIYFVRSLDQFHVTGKVLVGF